MDKVQKQALKRKTKENNSDEKTYARISPLCFQTWDIFK